MIFLGIAIPIGILLGLLLFYTLSRTGLDRKLFG